MDLTGESEPGKPMIIDGRVLGIDCQTPLTEAVLDVWQADAEGRYDNDSAEYRLRGQVMTDADGRFTFRSVRPENYSAAYPDCDIDLADINGDGSINAFDIEPFLDLLFP